MKKGSGTIVPDGTKGPWFVGNKETEIREPSSESHGRVKTSPGWLHMVPPDPDPNQGKPNSKPKTIKRDPRTMGCPNHRM